MSEHLEMRKVGGDAWYLGKRYVKGYARLLKTKGKQQQTFNEDINE
jgi:hypothetical protein